VSNHSHLHKNALGQEVDAFGMRDECDVCRERAGLPTMAEVALLRDTPGFTVGQLHGGQAPNDELAADLERAEAEVVALRTQLREGNPVLAAERDAALEKAGTLQRQVTALEKQVGQLTIVEGQLATSRTRIAELEQQLAASKPKK
jgi:hypothetical protein